MTTPLSARPITYRRALAAATEAAAGRDAPVVTSERIRSVTAATAESVVAARDRASDHTKRALRALWATVNPYSDAEVAAFATAAARVLEVAQSAAARAAAVAQAQQLTAMGIAVSATQSVPVNVRAPAATISAKRIVLHRPTVNVSYGGAADVTVTADDMTNEAVLRRPAAEYRYRISQGDLNAVSQSFNRIDSIVDDNLMLSQRLAQQQVLSAAAAPPVKNLDRPRTEIIGYRRVIHPELSRGGTCGMCIAASDRIYNVATLLPIHANCKCTIAAVTEDYDPADDLNTVDLSQLYKDSGGTSGAFLKRTRYRVDEHGELGPVLVPKGKYKPRTDQSKRRAGGTAVLDSKPETPIDVAARHLPLLQASLDDLRRRGLSEDAPQIVYHKQQIAKFAKLVAS